MQEKNKIENSKRVAKNTAMLYFRSFLSMLIGIYSSRVILSSLGVVDYGIYSLVGGVVGALSFLNSSLRQASQRYITVELGKLSETKVINKLFSMSINVHAIVAFVIFLLTEIFGLILLYNYLEIPEERLGTAFWVMQFSIITIVINIISGPYTSLIIAHEDLGSFAYIDLLTSFSKLFAAYIVSLFPYDHLFLYAFFILISSLLIRHIYSWFCIRKYKDEARYFLIWDKKLFKSMISFSTWTSISSLTSTFRKQGISIVYNMFHGILINSAFGIAYQVNNSVLGFVSNFSSAFMPRITKSYAAGSLDNTYKLVYICAKISYFIVLLFAIPIILECDFIMLMWLKKVPQHISIILALILFQDMMLNLCSGVNTAVRAMGKIRNYELTINTYTIIGFIFFCFLFYCDLPYYIPLLSTVISQLITSFIIVYNGHKLIGFPLKTYIYEVHLKMLMITILSFIIPGSIMYCMPQSGTRLVIVLFCSFIIITLLFYFIGLNSYEKEITQELVCLLKKKIKRKQ